MFKKILASFLAAATITAIPVGSITASAAGETSIYTHTLNRSSGEKTILSKSASYEISLTGAVSVSGLADDGKKLTDGVDNSYVGLQATGNGKATITVDLGKMTEALADFEISVLNDSSLGAKLPASVKLSVSDDDKKYIDVPYGGEIEKSPEDKKTYTVSFDPEEGITARYVRFEAEFTGKFYISEAAVYTYLSVEDVYNLGGGDQYADKQGVIYIIPDLGGEIKTAQVSGYFNQSSEKVTGKATTNAYNLSNNDGSSAKSALSKDTSTFKEEDYTYYYIGVGAEDYPEGVKVTALYLPKTASNRPGYIVKKRYVVMHNTGTYSTASTGYGLFQYAFSSDAANRSCSWHYSVGTDGIYQQLPDNENGWHDSSGNFGLGNYYGIALENCVNGFPGYKDLNKYWAWVEETFREVCKRAALLTVELCKRHGMVDPTGCTLGDTPIRQHWDSNRKNCPMEMRYNTATGAWTRDEGEMWVYYVSMVNRYWKGINGGGEYTTVEMKNTDNKVTDVVVPQYIRYDGDLYKVTYMFSNCFMNKTPLTSVCIPSTVNTSGSLTKAFYLSSNLKAIYVQEDSDYLSSDNGVLIYAKKTRIVPEAYDEEFAKGISNVYPVTKKPYEAPEPTPIKYGDVDGNDKIDSTDYILVKRHILKVNELSGDAFAAADMDGNGKLDSTDYIAIKRIILGITK